MTDESKLSKDRGRGARAQHLIEDDLLKEAFESLEAEYVKAWRSSEPRDGQGRENLYLAINVIGKVQQHLYRVIENGKLASKELDILSKG